MTPVRAILTTLLLPAAAAATTPADLGQCAAIAADAARLACYDRLARRDGAAPGAAGSAAPATPAPATPAPAPAAGPASPATPPAGRSFGLYAAEHPAPPPAARSIDARVTGVGTGANGRMTVTLEGGQLWELFDADPLLAAGDTVTITRASLGSFILQTPTRRSHRARRLR